MAKNLALEIAIRAKNLASSAVDKVKQSLSDTSTTADKAEKSLDDLGKQLDDIGQNRAIIDEFELLNEEIDNSEKVVRKLKSELTNYEKQAADSGQDTAEFKQEVTQLKTEIEKAETAIKGKRFELDKTVKSLKDADINTDELKRAEKELAAQANKTRQEIAEKNRALNNTKPSAVTGSAGIASLTKTVIGLGAAYVGVDKLFDSLRDIFTAGDKFEKLKIQFEGLMGSVEAGEQATDWVKDFTKNTPLQLEEVSQVFVKLKSFGIDPMNGSLQAITDQAFKLGGGFQEVEGISLALGQAWAKQKLQGEEILQLIERGVPVWELLEKATGKNTLELQKLSSEGKLGRDVIQKLMEQIAKDAKGAAADNMGTLSGLISNAKDNLTQFYNQIAESGALDWLKEQLTNVNAKFAEMTKDGSLKKWAKDISDAIISIGEGIKSTIGFLVEYRTQIATVVTAWATLKVGAFFSNVATGTVTSITALKSFVSEGVLPAQKHVNSTATSTSKLNNLLGKIGLAGAAALAGYELGKMALEFIQLKTYQKEINQAFLDGQPVRHKYEAQLREINLQTGKQFKSLKEVIEQQDKGNLALDEATGKWVYHADGVWKAIEAQKKAKQEQIETAKALRESQAAATDAAKVINENSKAWVENHKSLEDAKTALDKHISALEKDLPVGAQRSLGALQELRGELEKQIKASSELEEAYKTLGLESPKALQEAAQKSAAAFALIEQDATASKEVVSAAFNKMADDALRYAAATNSAIPPQIRAKAAALGLTEQLDKLDSASDASAGGIHKFKQSLNEALPQIHQVNSALQQQLDIQTQLNNQRRQYSAENSRNNLTESRTLTTTSGESVDIEKMTARELSDLRASYDKSASTTKFAHMREHYAKQIKIVDEQYNKVTDAARNQGKNNQNNNQASNTGSSNANNNTRTAAADSGAITDNTRALRALAQSVDQLNFTIQGNNDLVSELERLSSTS